MVGGGYGNSLSENARESVGKCRARRPRSIAVSKALLKILVFDV